MLSYFNGRSADHAGSGWKGQQVFSALAPFSDAIRHLIGEVNPQKGPAACQVTHARWEAFWACLPNLWSLNWTMTDHAFLGRSAASDFGLQSSLGYLQLTIILDDKAFSLAALQQHRYNEKLATLSILHFSAEGQALQLSADNGAFLVLAAFRCAFEAAWDIECAQPELHQAGCGQPPNQLERIQWLSAAAIYSYHQWGCV